MHWFLDPIKNHYADFSGRAGRQEFWMFALISFIINIILGVAVEVSSLFIVLQVLVALAIFIPSLALAVRRFHDTGKSGWWVLVAIIPFVGVIIYIVMLALRGEEGVNKYGPNPNEVAMAAADAMAMPMAAPEAVASVEEEAPIIPGAEPETESEERPLN